MIYHSIRQLKLPKTKENQFLKKGLETVEDIAYFFPRAYRDFRNTAELSKVLPGEYCALEGKVAEVWEGGNRSYTARIETGSPGISPYATQFLVSWFGSDYYIRQLEIGRWYIFCGKASEFRGYLQITSPLLFGQNREDVCKILPVYSKIQGMSMEYLVRQIENSINLLAWNDKSGPKDVFARSIHMMPKYEAIREMHRPQSMERLKLAKQRMDFEIIYDFYDNLRAGEVYTIGTQIPKMTHEELTHRAIASLPFVLTEDQSKVMESIIKEAKTGKRMNSLISGDVGCGKTVIAILACIFMKENGYQSIVMAPTLVLARQHYQEFQEICQDLGITVGLLTTETKKRERNALLSAFSKCQLDILVGTHSVLNDEVCGGNLGLTIIDEEHKFGVEQKEKLQEFDKAGVHHLSMTATPIPRSIARAIYGSDTRILSIHTMPAGRKSVITKQYTDINEIWEKMYAEVQAGHQCYVVCPFIEDSAAEDFQDVISVAAASNKMSTYFQQKPNLVKIGILSGNMKQQSILDIVHDFKNGKLDVLLSTTIVEVGVNVPNATVIAILSAERFGLAGLHQLRGRVGRGDAQSFCLLFSEKHKERLDILCKTNDGFAIAEEDLRLRGPGDIAGFMQSGESNEVNAIIRQPKLAQIVRAKVLQTENFLSG